MNILKQMCISDRAIAEIELTHLLHQAKMLLWKLNKHSLGAYLADQHWWRMKYEQLLTSESNGNDGCRNGKAKLKLAATSLNLENIFHAKISYRLEATFERLLSPKIDFYHKNIWKGMLQTNRSSHGEKRVVCNFWRLVYHLGSVNNEWSNCILAY